jgi:microcystin degradation protein MlrC
MTRYRIGVAAVLQETNTFSSARTTLEEFEAQSILAGERVNELIDTNTEAGGALTRLAELDVDPVPIFRAWAMSGGPITSNALDELLGRFRQALEKAGALDGLVLALHGAFVGEAVACADLVVLDTARSVVGDIPIGVTVDLHANVTTEMVDRSSFLIGYHTYPHVDMATTGARAADLLVGKLRGECRPVTRLAKRPFLIPAEAQGEDGAYGALRNAADAETLGSILDITLLPVQPWLDVPELGYGVTVTTDGDPGLAGQAAERLAEAAWQARASFDVELFEPMAAIEQVRANLERPVLLTESADSPSAGAAADSPAMIRALLELAPDLRAYMTLVDGPAVERCFKAGTGKSLQLHLGSTIDRRFHEPVELEGTVVALGAGPYRLTGPVFNGMEYMMGRYARIDAGQLSILATELPACTFDPEAFRQVGLDPTEADIVVVRSAHMYRAGWSEITSHSIVLDLPGASTPKLSSLTFKQAPRPMYPIDAVQ